MIALCLGTRHHDGHLREACVRQLLQQQRAWTVPFVVHLCGEYVLQIVEVIGAALPAWNGEALARYLRENYPGRRTMAALRALQQLTLR